MDYLDRLGSLALGSRLKRLSERLGQEVAEVYASAGVEFEPKWFPLFRLLTEQQLASVTDVAAMVGITHPAVNQIAQELTSAGLLTSVADKNDGRKRLLSLSVQGNELAMKLKSTWQALHCSLSNVFEDSNISLLNAVCAAERALDEKGLLSRYKETSTLLAKERPQLVDFSPDLAHHFARLNRTWIEKYFCMEDADFKVFANPQKIIDTGGSIFFVRIGSRVVGTGALVRVDAKTFELVKMAVDEAYQGHGLGRLLLQACIDRARQCKAKTVILETNSNLKAAVHLYERFGFKQLDDAESPYKRVDLVMRLALNANDSTDSRPKKKQKAPAK